MYHAFQQFESALAAFHAAQEINHDLLEELSTYNRRHEQGLLCLKIGDVYRDGRRLETALEYYQRALAAYEELVKDAPTPLHKRGLQTAFSRINNIRFSQQRFKGIPSPELFQSQGATPLPSLGVSQGLRTSTPERLPSGQQR